jgi:PD-(D/E)XK endonuclease
MKPRCPYKRRGEWVELCFAAKAIEAGLRVSRPYGDSDRYDSVVEYSGNMNRVQIKSTAYRRPESGAYRANEICNRMGPYTTTDIDFLAMFVVPESVWYIIPVQAIAGRKSVSFRPHDPNHRSHYEQYREAWHLLKR